MRKARQSKALGLGVAMVMFGGFALGACSGKGPDHRSSRSIPANYVEGSFVVTASEAGSEEGIRSTSEDVAKKLGCSVKKPERISWGDSSSDTAGVLSKDLQNTFNVNFENCDFSREGTKAIAAELAGGLNIVNVEAEAVAAATPLLENDPDKTNQGHLPFIRRDKACEAAERKGPPVIVAVVDSGVMTSHPDLKDVLLRDAQGNVVGANFVGTGSSMPANDEFDDQNGHGTHVAGLIGAAANNGKGVVGVGACANVKIMPVRVLNAEGSGSSIEIDRGVKWAADHGAQIINLSLGYVSQVFPGSTSAFKRAIFTDLANKDVVVLAAAGNDGFVSGNDDDNDGSLQYDFPASYDNVIAVTATNNSGSLASFSNRGDRVDIAAPGYNVLSTTFDGSYGRMSGTSMATPVAAGAYALALATARAGLESTIDRVDVKIAESLLLSSTLTGASLPTSDVKAGGVIDVEKLVKAMAQKYPKEEPTQPTQPTQPTNPSTPSQPTTPTQPTIPTTPTTPSQPTTPTQPTTPSQPDPQPAKFAFDGLSDGQAAGWPQTLKVVNLPKGTAKVAFYWGYSPWSFAKVYVDSPSQTTLEDEDEWYLYGNRTLTAVAYNAYGRVIGKAKVAIKGW